MWDSYKPQSLPSPVKLNQTSLSLSLLPSPLYPEDMLGKHAPFHLGSASEEHAHQLGRLEAGVGFSVTATATFWDVTDSQDHRAQHPCNFCSPLASWKLMVAIPDSSSQPFSASPKHHLPDIPAASQFFCRRPDSRYFRLCRSHTVSVTTAQLCLL